LSKNYAAPAFHSTDQLYVTVKTARVGSWQFSQPGAGFQRLGAEQESKRWTKERSRSQRAGKKSEPLPKKRAELPNKKSKGAKS